MWHTTMKTRGCSDEGSVCSHHHLQPKNEGSRLHKKKLRDENRKFLNFRG